MSLAAWERRSGGGGPRRGSWAVGRPPFAAAAATTSVSAIFDVRFDFRQRDKILFFCIHFFYSSLPLFGGAGAALQQIANQNELQQILRQRRRIKRSWAKRSEIFIAATAKGGVAHGWQRLVAALPQPHCHGQCQCQCRMPNAEWSLGIEICIERRSLINCLLQHLLHLDLWHAQLIANRRTLPQCPRPALSQPLSAIFQLSSELIPM